MIASVHTRGPFMSGSKVAEEEFLLLRAIWPNIPKADNWKAHTKLGLDAQFRKATDYLAGMQEFDNYLEAISKSLVPKDTTNLGIFWPVYNQQYRVIQSPLPELAREEKAYSTNERLVKFSLVSFLQTVCARHSDVESNWNPAPVKLTFDFMKVKKDKEKEELRADVFSLSCQIDGFLESMFTFRTQSLLEAKALKCEDHKPKVSWQETMAMVAALLNKNPTKSLPKDR